MNIERLQADSRGVRTIQPELVGAPCIVLQESAQDTVARFFLEMTGIERGLKGSRGSEDTRHSARLRLPSLEHGQIITLVHSIRDGTLQAPLLIGEARAASVSTAVSAARALWSDLDATLHDAGLFRFEPRTASIEASPSQISGTSFEVKPTGLRLDPGVSAGFAGGQAHTAPPILVPQLPQAPAAWLTSLTSAGQSIRGRLDVSIRFESFRLDNALRETLGREHLRFAGHLQHPGYQQPLACHPESLLALEHLILRLLRNEHLLRVHLCSVSDRPPPRFFLQRLGEEFFGHSDLELCALDEPSARAATDLRTVFPTNLEAPPLFPAPDALIAAGIEHAYSWYPPELPEHGLLLGHVRGRAAKQSVRLQTTDRDRHCYILGATGTGKSTLLRNMIAQDIAAGEGICLIDPHGDLYHDVLDGVPESRLEDVVQIDVEQTDRSVGINLLDCGTPPSEHRTAFAISELLNIAYKLFDHNPEYFGPVFDQYFRNTAGLLLHQKVLRGTVADFPAVFNNEELRKKLIASCTDANVVAFWRLSEKRTGDYSVENHAMYVTSKLGAFVENPRLRRIISQGDSSLQFRELLEGRKILLVNLAKGLLGEYDARLLGMLVLGKLFEAALQRADIPRGDRHPFKLYVDEAHSFITETMSLMLAESRKFGLQMVLANQTLAQLQTKQRANVLESVLGNVGTMIFYRLGPIDARAMAPQVEPELQSHDLISLPAYHAATRLLVDGRPTSPFVFRAMARARTVLSPSERSRREERLALSRQQYARPNADVDLEMSKRHDVWINGR